MEKKYLIALGASAGGLAALSEFFDNTLPDAVSYVITTHLYPHEKSVLDEIIQRHTTIAVVLVEDNMVIQPNVIYVMPENKVMSIEDGRLRLWKRDLSIKVNMAIDIFFKSLAKDEIFRKIAIILTGLGDDGTRGVQKIQKTAGILLLNDRILRIRAACRIRSSPPVSQTKFFQ